MLYTDFISDKLRAHLKRESIPVPGVDALTQIGVGGGLETTESLGFLVELYLQLKAPLEKILNQRAIDREFIDQRTRACVKLNQDLHIDFTDPKYETVLGQEDGSGRIVVGPKSEFYAKRGYGNPVAPIPESLVGNHITLFGPPGEAKLCINAMNAYHRKLKDEPSIIPELLSFTTTRPKWGADDEDSKTPLRSDLASAGKNLSHCYERTLAFTDPKSQKEYRLETSNLSVPIKRFPGLALPCFFLFYKNEPLPLHLYDFALHLFTNWNCPEALTFYVPKLENEEEAAYIRLMMETAEKLIQQRHPEYEIGTIRLLIVLENPRAIFRTNEIMDTLHPYFAGASLGWHDYLASTARLFREDPNYRIPVKADPNIVIKYIKASHDLVAEVVGSRGGIKVGGMYGVLPMDTDRMSPSFQVTLKGFFKDIVTQLKRNLSGFWVAHPDFVRIGIALVEAYQLKKKGQGSYLDLLVTSLLKPEHHKEILDFIHGPDIQGLERDHPLYARSLIVADLKESPTVANHHSDEVRYNVFQSLQYLTDWLSGNGCVALPAQIGGVSVRVMDDLATAERSRWEVWHEIHHGRLKLEDFVKIAHEELRFIRKDLSNEQKIVQVKWDERTEKWYPVAFKLMLKLMSSQNPPEFATELLLPFTVDSIRNASDPWQEIVRVDPEKFSLDPTLDRLNEYFSICGSMAFAKPLAMDISLDIEKARSLILNFTLNDILEAASFHGNIGENKKTLDEVASKEQALVIQEGEALRQKLTELGAEYLTKFGFKYLVSAQGKTATDLLSDLTLRLNNPVEIELTNAKNALFEISLKRLQPKVEQSLHRKIDKIRDRWKITGAQIAVSTSNFTPPQTIVSGERIKGGDPVTPETWFEVASLSKTMGSVFALEYFRSKKIPLDTSVNRLLEQSRSTFRLKSQDPKHPQWAALVKIPHLMKHNALNMHYVNGVPADRPMANARDLLDGNATYQYPPVRVLFEPGSAFQYSGGGFLVLEHLIESFEKNSIQEITDPFFQALDLKDLSFRQETLEDHEYAHGYLDSGAEVEGTRKQFPAFAAGAMGTASDYLKFLQALAHAYSSTKGFGPISHDTAIQVLHSTDRSSQTFMGVNIGLGVFIAEAGPNRLAIHQGANDGFRCLSVHCFSGPNAGAGFVILCNGDNQGVLFIAEVAQEIFKHLQLEGVDTSRFQSDFSGTGVKQEELVNLGYKHLIFGAFNPSRAEEIIVKGPKDPLAPINLAANGIILEVSNDRFARAENLLSDHLPIFDPGLYGKQGKIMDSWESVRHNRKPAQDPHDELIFRMRTPSTIRMVSFSTAYHLGNQAQAVSLDARTSGDAEWKTLLPKTELKGHAIQYVALAPDNTVYQDVRVNMYPDGGLSRLGLFDHVLPGVKDSVIADPIPHPQKPLSPKYHVNTRAISENWKRLPHGSEVNVASSALGATVVKASNEHYGPAIQVISPYPPINMFDGFESARSRVAGHSEYVIIGLAKKSKLHRIEIDFTYFVNNNPVELMIEGLHGKEWLSLVPRTVVKAYAGNQISFHLDPKVSAAEVEQLRITVYPDGGMNRVKAFSRA